MVEKNRAERGKVVAGIDVGGTFTDLILIDGRDGGKVHDRQDADDAGQPGVTAWLPHLPRPAFRSATST